MEMDVQSHLLGHLGIVAGIFDKLNIAEVIDRILPKRGSRNLLHSVITKAMILNGMVTNQFGLPLFVKSSFTRQSTANRQVSKPARR
jgi:hypothetical protein